MQKPSETLDWKDTNLALFGSDLEKKIKAAAADGEVQWKGVGTKEGLTIWRIEQFQVKPWPKRKYGKFHKGDSYVILNTYKPEDAKADKLSHDIHIWIGSESTQDEYGTAAYKMVELDDKLGGAAVQHRQVEGKEAPLFSDYFHGKITYLRGGIESGFRHVEEPTVDDPHLYQIKGTIKANSLRLTQIPVRRDCMNSGDVFLLVASSEAVWLWMGKESNPDEKTKAMEVARAFCTKGNVRVLEEGVNDGEKQDAQFWKYLPGKVQVLGPLLKRSVHVRDADDKDDKGREFVPMLYEIRGSSTGFKHLYKAKQLPVGPTKQLQYKIPRSKLKATGAYLLDSGFHVYLWMGSKADATVKAEAIPMAQKYIKDYRRPQLPVSVLKERMENAGFQDLMTDQVDGGCACVIL